MAVTDNMKDDTYTIELAENPVDVIIALLREIPCVDVFPPLIGNNFPSAIDPNTWNLSKSIFPEYPCSGPDGVNNPRAAYNDIVVCQTSGKASNPKWLIDYPGITILVRAAGSRYPQAYDICRCINDALLGFPGCDYGPDRQGSRDRLVSITQQGQIIDLGRESRDTVKRCNFSLNYNLIVQPAQTPLSRREPLL